MQSSSERIIEIALASLQAHKKNTRYVKDIVGDEWELFLEDISERGIVQPLIVTLNDDKQSYTVVSGHQRLRAAQHLNKTSLPCLVFDYADAQEAEADLIRVNAMQRHYSIGEKYKLTAYLLEKADDRRKRREHNKDGTFAASRGAELRHNGESPIYPRSREQIAKKVPGITKDDIDNIKKLSKLPPKEAQPLYDWIDEHNPSKKRIRERIKELEEKLKVQTHAKKGAQRRFNDLRKDYEKLQKENRDLVSLKGYEEYLQNPHIVEEGRNLTKLLAVLSELRSHLRDHLGFLGNFYIDARTRDLMHETRLVHEIMNYTKKLEETLLPLIQGEERLIQHEEQLIQGEEQLIQHEEQLIQGEERL